MSKMSGAQSMLVFRGGEWHAITLPFEDPGLSQAHRRAAAAIMATELVAGKPTSVAEQVAEARMYDIVYGGGITPSSARVAGKQHDAPKHHEKQRRVQEKA